MSLRYPVLSSPIAIAITVCAVLSTTMVESVSALVIPVIDAGGIADGSGGNLQDLSTSGDTIGAITGSFSGSANADYAAAGPSASRWDGSEFDYSPDSTATATWTFGGMTSGEMWDVFISWHNSATPQANLTTMAPYTIQGGANIIVDQRTPTAPDIVLTDSASTAVKFQKLGTATVNGSGEVSVTLSGTGLGGGTDWVIADAVALTPFDAPDLQMSLTINRDTGGMEISNGTATVVEMLAYSLTSPGGAFDATGWKSIAENYDADGPNTADLGALIGTVDDNDNWTLLSDLADPTDLSEAELVGGDGAMLAASQTIDLGNAWRRSPAEDILFEYLLADGSVVEGTTDFAGNGGEGFKTGDLNLDGTAFGIDDFTEAMLPNLVSELTTRSGVEAYLAGDLDSDFDVDREDFRIFKAGFLAAGGSAATLAAAVPEPSTTFLVLAAAAFAWPRGRRRFVHGVPVKADASAARSRGRGFLLRGVCGGLVVLFLVAGVTSTVSAQLITVLDDDEDRDFVAGPGVVDIDMSSHDNGGFGINADTFNDTFAFNLNMDASSSTYTVTGLSAGRDYNVYGYWRGQVNTPQALYTVGDGGAATLVDQTLRSAADILITDPDPNGNNGALGTSFPFQSLGTITENGDGQLDVTITNGGGGGFFLADAVAVSLVVDPLLLEVNTTTGFASIIDNGRDTFDIDTYEITSASGSLDPTWSGLPGWMNGGASDAFRLSDFNLASSTQFVPTDTFSIGHAFNTTVGGEDLLFNYTTGDGNLLDGVVSYVTGGLICDINGDTNCDLDDVDRLYDDIAAGTVGGPSDIDGNGVVDNDDIDAWLTAAGATNGKVYRSGDTNLDGDVGGPDFTSLALNFGNSGTDPSVAESYWRHGNFDGNGTNGVFEVGGSDFTGLALNFGHESVNAVPEPAAASLAFFGLFGAMSLARRRRFGSPPKFSGLGSASLIAGVIAMGGWLTVNTAVATVSNDRDYTFGEDSLEGAAPNATIGGNNTSPLGPGQTADSIGPSGAFLDLNQVGDPTYQDVGPIGLNRPGAFAGEFGARFDGTNDRLTGIRFNRPDELESLIGTYPLNYIGITVRGLQAWVYPDQAGINAGTYQSIVFDSIFSGGPAIDENGRWTQSNSFHVNGAGQVPSTVSVTGDTWYHVMHHNYAAANSGGPSVVTGTGFERPFTSVLFVDGIAVSANNDNIDLGGNDAYVGQLVVGAAEVAGDGSLAVFDHYFDGVMDDLEMYVYGDNTSVGGQDYGAFDLLTDNEWIVTAISDTVTGGVLKDGDINFDGVVTQDDVVPFVDNWKREKLLVGAHNTVRVGDWETRGWGDFNVSGKVDLSDAFVLHEALLAAGQGGLDFSLLSVPEPASIVLLAISGLGFLRIRRQNRVCS